MKRRLSMLKCNLIVARLKQGSATFKEINEYLKNHSQLEDTDYTVSKRSFHRYISDLYELFRIEITWNKSIGKYELIENNSLSIGINILHTYGILHGMRVKSKISEYLIYEDRDRKGLEWFPLLLRSIEQQTWVEFRYCKFINDEDSTRLVVPLGLKEFRNRWYLFARDISDGLFKTFALDRMSKVKDTIKRYPDMLDFDINKHFQDCFGITRPNDNTVPTRVLIETDLVQGKYIESRMLHPTQNVRVDGERVLITCNVYLTTDFVMELLSYGSRIKVVHPPELVNRMRNELQMALNKYGSNE